MDYPSSPTPVSSWRHWRRWDKDIPTSNMSSQRVVYAGDLRSCRIAQLARSPCSCTSALASFTVPRPYR